MPSLPSAMLSTTFVDGELVNEAKLYARVFGVINSIIAWGAALPVSQNGSFVGTILTGANFITGTVTFPTAYGAAPVVVPVVASAGNFIAQITATTTTNFTWRVARSDGTNSPAGNAVTITWISFG